MELLIKKIVYVEAATRGVLEKKVSLQIKIHRKTPVPESHFK